VFSLSIVVGGDSIRRRRQRNIGHPAEVAVGGRREDRRMQPEEVGRPVEYGVPAQLTRFIGRAEQIPEVHGLLRGNRLVTLTGSGGCGKSRLAQQVAAGCRDSHPDGVWWVELAPVTDGALVPAAVLSGLGLADVDGEPLAHLTGYLARRRCLVVIDNCEHLLGAVAELVHQLLRACPGLVVLATSREPLGVPGEQAWRVPSMSVPEATRLFEERARLVRPNLRLDERGAAAVAAICRRLDGIPLAVELAASRTRAMSVAAILDGLDDRFRLLTGGPQVLTSRQQTLSASVGWSHDLLSPAERTLFRRMSVFAGGFSLDGAEAVCSGDGLDPLDVLDLLTQLVDKSLVVPEDDLAGTRYRLLETIRQFGSDRLADAGESAGVRARHAWFLRDLACAAEPLIEAADPDCLDTLEAEHDNLRAAHEWAVRSDPVSALCMAAPLTLFWYQRGHYGEGRLRLREALDAAPDAPADLRARALWGLAHLAFYSGNHLDAQDPAAAALALAEQAGEARIRARVQGLLGWMEMFVDPAAARARLVGAVELAREAGDQWSLADDLQAMGWTYVVQDDHAAAQPILDEAAAVAVGLGNPYFLAWNGGTSGQAAVRTGSTGGPRGRWRRASQRRSRLGSPTPWRGSSRGRWSCGSPSATTQAPAPRPRTPTCGGWSNARAAPRRCGGGPPPSSPGSRWLRANSTRRGRSWSTRSRWPAGKGSCGC
jgi:predicted ATPase